MTDEQIKAALGQSPEAIPYEDSPEINESPLSEPVKDADLPLSEPVTQTPESDGAEAPTPEVEGTQTNPMPDDQESQDQRPLDAPEQNIGDPFQAEEEPPKVEIPPEQAEMAANAFIEMADNFLALGSGFFVKIKKHEEFYDFEEVVQVIDSTNATNIEQMRLQEAEKAVLRPLLMQVIMKRALNVTPEQQLLGVTVSILISKLQVMMMIRKQNALLEDRIRQIIRQERQAAAPQAAPDPSPSSSPTPQEEDTFSEVKEEVAEEAPVA